MVYKYYILYFIAFLLLYLLIVDFVFLFNSTDYNGTSKLDDSATKADRMIGSRVQYKHSRFFRRAK